MQLMPALNCVEMRIIHHLNGLDVQQSARLVDYNLTEAVA